MPQFIDLPRSYCERSRTGERKTLNFVFQNFNLRSGKRENFFYAALRLGYPRHKRQTMRLFYGVNDGLSICKWDTGPPSSQLKTALNSTYSSKYIISDNYYSSNCNLPELISTNVCRKVATLACLIFTNFKLAEIIEADEFAEFKVIQNGENIIIIPSDLGSKSG